MPLIGLPQIFTYCVSVRMQARFFELYILYIDKGVNVKR